MNWGPSVIRPNSQFLAQDQRAIRTRVFLLAGILAFFLPAGGQAAPVTSAPSTERRTYTADESRKLGDEARRLAEARQSVWDRKMKAISRSVCTGC